MPLWRRKSAAAAVGREVHLRAAELSDRGEPAVGIEVLPAARADGPNALSVRGLESAKLANFSKFCKFLAGSFSAVSKRNFARKYAFDSIFQALQDVHTFAPLQTQHVTWIFSKNRFKTTASIVKLQQQFR